MKGGKSGSGSGSTSLRSPNPAPGNSTTPPTPGTAKRKVSSVSQREISRSTTDWSQQSPHYGSMTDTPRPLRRLDSNPPPLDLGEAGASATDESSPELRAMASSSKTPMSPADVGTVPGPKHTVSFKGSPRVEAKATSPRSPALGQVASRPSVGSTELRSSEEGQTDSSSKLLYPEAGPSKPRPAKTSLKLSPKLTFSPRLENAFVKLPRNPPKSGPRSLRTFLLAITMKRLLTL